MRKCLTFRYDFLTETLTHFEQAKHNQRLQWCVCQPIQHYTFALDLYNL